MIRFTQVLMAIVVVLATVPAATAQSDDAVIDVFGSDEDMTLLDRIGAANDALTGVANRLWFDAKSVFQSDDDDRQAVERQADDVQQIVNANNESIQSYINQRFSGNASEWNVIAVRFEQGDAAETRYLVADVNETDGSFENGSMVESTSRSVDAEVLIEDYAAENAATELQRFVDNYVKPNTDVDRALRRRLAQQYLGDVELPEEVRN